MESKTYSKLNENEITVFGIEFEILVFLGTFTLLGVFSSSPFASKASTLWRINCKLKEVVVTLNYFDVFHFTKYFPLKFIYVVLWTDVCHSLEFKHFVRVWANLCTLSHQLNGIFENLKIEFFSLAMTRAQTFGEEILDWNHKLLKIRILFDDEILRTFYCVWMSNSRCDFLLKLNYSLDGIYYLFFANRMSANSLGFV